jgi:hypothetical protein
VVLIDYFEGSLTTLKTIDKSDQSPLPGWNQDV